MWEIRLLPRVAVCWVQASVCWIRWRNGWRWCDTTSDRAASPPAVLQPQVLPRPPLSGEDSPSSAPACMKNENPLIWGPKNGNTFSVLFTDLKCIFCIMFRLRGFCWLTQRQKGIFAFVDRSWVCRHGTHHARDKSEPWGIWIKWHNFELSEDFAILSHVIFVATNWPILVSCASDVEVDVSVCSRFQCTHLNVWELKQSWEQTRKWLLPQCKMCFWFSIEPWWLAPWTSRAHQWNLWLKICAPPDWFTKESNTQNDWDCTGNWSKLRKPTF